VIILPGLSNEIFQNIVAYGPIVLMLVVFYFVVYRPQKQEQQRRAAMLSSLKKGGMYGTITAIDTKKVTLKVAEKIEIDFLRSAVQSYQVEPQKN